MLLQKQTRRSLLDIGKLATYLFNYNGKVAYFVLVDPQCSETWHVGKLDMSAVVVAIQDESTQLVQFPQKSWAPLMAELRQNVIRG